MVVVTDFDSEPGEACVSWRGDDEQGCENGEDHGHEVWGVVRE